MKSQRSVWKFILLDEPLQIIRVPPPGIFRHIAFQQGDGICLWAEVDPKAPKEDRGICLATTGSELPSTAQNYLGTVHTDGGATILHAYEYRPA